LELHGTVVQADTTKGDKGAISKLSAPFVLTLLRLYHAIFDYIDAIGLFVINDGLYLNRYHFTRHLSVIQNGYKRGEYEQQPIQR
jgi:hypothetical protein